MSYIQADLVKLLGIPVKPNGQLAQLAIPSARAVSMGEVDFLLIEASTASAVLRLRALVMPSLSVPCYGGRTFKFDNDIVDYVKTLTVTMHGGLFTVNLSDKIGPLPERRPPPYLSIQPIAASQEVLPSSIPPPTTPSNQDEPTAPPPSKITPVLMKNKVHLLPQGVHAIPCDLPDATKVLVIPPRSPLPSPTLSEWPPQMCDVALGSALYVNETKSPLVHGKNTHFRLVPMAEQPVQPPMSCPVNLLALSTPKQPDSQDIFAQLANAINTSVLTPDQVGRLNSLHRKYITAFNEDMSGGFQDLDHPYYATFSFKDEN